LYYSEVFKFSPITFSSRKSKTFVVFELHSMEQNFYVSTAANYSFQLQWDYRRSRWIGIHIDIK